MYAFLLLFIIIKGSIAHTGKSHWSYHGADGPESWGGTCKSGMRQSPIDIHAAHVDYAFLDPINFINYESDGSIYVLNNGHTVLASGFENWGEHQPSIEGGGLRYRYNLLQFHLHWAQKNYHGSEHMISGMHYPAELHMVHMRDGVELMEALKDPEGFMVLGIFIVIRDDDSSLDKFSSSLQNVSYPGNKTDIEGFSPLMLLPKDTDAFYRYDGSLTTPPCTEAIVWTIFAEPISITPSEMIAIRKLQSREGGPYLLNDRPVQQLNGRRVLFRSNSLKKKELCPTQSAVRITIVLALNIVFYVYQIVS